MKDNVEIADDLFAQLEGMDHSDQIDICVGMLYRIGLEIHRYKYERWCNEVRRINNVLKNVTEMITLYEDKS